MHVFPADAARPILIAGPTASGKSALALELAERERGIVVNADSMQVYRELAILTARPGPEDIARAPHALYGHVSAGEPYSVARWLQDAARVLADAVAAGRRPVIVGGTGLYFKALTEGLSPVPAIPEAVRDRWRTAARAMPAEALHAELRARDPVMARRLATADRQRVTRALEVVEATGRSLAEWQTLAVTPLIVAEAAVKVVILPPRQDVQERCDARFDQMIEAGALDEVRRLSALGLDPSLPAMRAIGVRPLVAHLAGELDFAAAVAAGKLETRQYVKRQQTWLKRYNSSYNVIKTIITCENISENIKFIDERIASHH